jgi:prevent-host-death family protein
MTTQVDLAEAQAHLPDLLERAAKGEDIVITQPGKARVRLVPDAERQEPRQPGRLKGQIWFGPDFDKDLTDQFEDL